MESTCAACGGTFKQRGGRGRPRRYCATCVPSPGVVGSAETARRWRCVNPERVQARNVARRVTPLPRDATPA